MPIITPPAITKQRAVLPTKQLSPAEASHGNRYSSRLTHGEADESKGQRQMRINQACLRWLGAVFRLQLFRPGVLYVGSRNAPLSR
jgi:hypothetical protein